MTTEASWAPSLLNTETDPIEAAHSNSWRVTLGTTGSVAIAITSIFIKAVNPYGLGKQHIAGTLLSLVTGAALQNAVQVGLPRELSVREKNFLADYATPIFLICSQIYLNVEPSSAMREGMFAGLTALGGAAVAALVHTLVVHSLDEQVKGGTLSTSMVDLGSDRTKRTIRFPLLNSPTSRIAWNVAKGMIGVGAIAIGSTMTEVGLLRDFGVILTADSATQCASEFILNKMKELHDVAALPLLDENRESHLRQLHYYQTLIKVLLAASHALPGMAIVFGTAAEKAKLPLIVSLLGYAFTGFFNGARRHIERSRFTEVPVEELKELKYKPEPLTPMEKGFRIGKWAFGILGVGGFIALGVAGLNPQTGRFINVNPFDRAALATFGVALYAGYAIAEIARQQFKKSKDSRFVNMAYFFTQYSQGIPLLALYIMEKMEIGDRALAQDSILAGILGCVAYASLGHGVGIEANARGEFPQPRVATSLAMALIGRFVAHELTNQIK